VVHYDADVYRLATIEMVDGLSNWVAACYRAFWFGFRHCVFAARRAQTVSWYVSFTSTARKSVVRPLIQRILNQRQTLMANRFKSLILHDHKTVVAKVDGEMDVATMNSDYRRILSADPRHMGYALLLDLRSWIGMTNDDELKETARSLKDLRVSHDITDPIIPFVYLGRAGSGVEFIAEQMAKFRGRNVMIAHTPEAAWALLIHGTPIPHDVANFLGK